MTPNLLPALTVALAFSVGAHDVAAARPDKSGRAAAQPAPAAAPNLSATQATQAGVRAITAEALLKHIKTLASDEFEGRAPASNGETITLSYLQGQFKQLGLEPGNPDGSYLQKVPMLGISSHPSLKYTAPLPGSVSVPLQFPEDYVAWTARTEKSINVSDSELVFVGYGVNAPEFHWDDYKGVDLKGKTLLMLINDPPVADPKHPGQLDPNVFGGKAMSYYGRWTYKFEMAAKLGAAAALIVHETKPAAYPFEVVRNSWGRENFAIRCKGVNPAFPPLPGWLQLERARELAKAGGHDFDALKQAALSRDFKPVPLGVRINMSAQNVWREVGSHNLVAKISGSDPAVKDEVVIYSAHWDHFGIDESLPGPRTQQIFHGAKDNASGVAALLEVARAYKALPTPPRRTILFLLTTGEERGLLGAQYYASYPLYPLAKTLLDINVDGLNLWGRTRDVELSGMGKSSADEVVAEVARGQGRLARPDSNSAFGSFYRADQFEFAKVGVPVVYVRGGTDFIGKRPGYAQQKLLNYTAHDYHTVNDVVQPDWDLGGAVQDVALLFQVGYQVAQGKEYPHWKSGAEFKAVRERMLAAPPK
ncbi:M28 family peptidase [Rugamonas sp. CCM 8940]|uniref:M28 family peptidase n=1 Tax=Rugamonas sp. CCM 8940 TaxID=2765359 RepID=UPI0018F44BA7|nr:M28 family peptidase [Rugamonas sp. CCM 8940]MBJ7309747.1 M20/M25/M40 family metallo-hydrolase [Rugamonas sp. CCM 8940]